jgi:hypothetical protein
MKIFITLLIVIILSFSAKSQSSTYGEVYNLLQSKCTGGCHGSGHVSGLKLTGSMNEVYDELYDVDPTNVVALEKRNKRVFPGDPYKSFLFRKINNGLASDVTLEAGEGTNEPKGLPPLSKKKIELVRQWIIYGAQEDGVQVDTNAIADFYDDGGVQSIPSPPAPPPAEEGFQIHLGPFFLLAGEEKEYWAKVYTQLSENKEVIRLDSYIGDYSHHLMVSKYPDEFTANAKPYGLRTFPAYDVTEFVSAFNHPDVLQLPVNTAFWWENKTVLEFDTHYINFSPDKVHACDVYLNVYTQDFGSSLYEMHTEFQKNLTIYIPNDSLPHTLYDTLFQPDNPDVFFIWALTTHTHKYAIDFNIYKRNTDGTMGEQIFDGACEATSGVPGCTDEIYDFLHVPVRYWDTFYPVHYNEGFIEECTWINDGPVPVAWGNSQDDEMMSMIYFYIDDTAGLNIDSDTTSEDTLNNFNVTIYPNPASNYLNISYNNSNEASIVEIITLEGSVCLNFVITNNGRIDVSNLPAGMYYLKMILDNKIVMKALEIMR